jgi:Fuc2NAc and GlcNAc transferase
LVYTELSIIAAIFVFTAACLLASAGLWLFLRIQPRIGLMDVPNERSSHSAPVPRGGGIIVVTVAVLLYITVSLTFGNFPDIVFVAAGLLVALVSLIDDLRSIPLLPRLATHIVAASTLVWSNGGYPGLDLDPIGINIPFGAAAPVLSVLFIVWMINAYNFMDGIDGILGIQGLCAGMAWVGIGILWGSFTATLLGAALAGCCLGFLFFNWQPARVFMGDVGSTFLGFAVASIPLVSSDGEGIERSSGLILSLCFSVLFLFDTGFTRILLILRGAKFWLPHREHIYQKLVRSGIPHWRISAYFGVMGSAVSALSVIGAILGGAYATVAIGAGLAACAFLLIRTRKILLT